MGDGNRRVLEGWAAQTDGITGEPDGARVLYFKKERDE